MPFERRRHPTPDDSEFANPRARKMYEATERLLDAAPETGRVRQKFLLDSWNSIRDEFLQQGESADEARQIAWGTMAFFYAERVGDIALKIASNPKLNIQLFRFELNTLSAWGEMHKLAYNDETKSYIGEPKDYIRFIFRPKRI